MFQFSSEQFRVKVGLAEMLKGGVIMDVTNAEQAKIAEDAGASAVMALERVPADIRKEGGVARMANIAIIEEIMETVTIPVMAKARIGHFMEARILEALGVDYIDESEVLTPADEEHHIDKTDFKVPFVCGARNLGEALRRIAEGAAMIRTKGEAGSGNIVEAVRHMRTIVKEMKQLTVLGKEELVHEAKKLQAPLELVEWVARARQAAGAELLGRRHRHAGRCGAGDATGRRGGVRRLGHLQVVRSGGARQGHREGRQELTTIPRSCWKPAARWARPCRGSTSPRLPESRAAADAGLVDEARSECSRCKAISRRTARRWSAPAPSRCSCAQRQQFGDIDGLIIPGGESTTMLKLLQLRRALMEPLAEFGRANPIFGTCAGAILMANEVSSPAQESLGLMDMAVERNAYGRQIDSRVAEIEPEPEFEERTAPGKLEAVFIRAPIIRRGPEQGAGALPGRSGPGGAGRHLVATFHPELTADSRVHALFLEKL